MSRKLRLRPLSNHDSDEARAIHHACLQEGSVFLLDYEPSWTWDHYLGHLSDLEQGRNLPEGRVPASFLVASLEQDTEILGRISIRHAISTPYLRNVGGHIGYVVTPGKRRYGYGTLMLDQALQVAGSLGIDKVLVTTDEDNVGSQKVIERCGGVLETITQQHADQTLRRYWITISVPAKTLTETVEIENI